MGRGVLDDSGIRKSDLVDVAGSVKRETEKAWLIDFGDAEVWVPKSQVEIADNTVTMPEWLATKHGLI